MAVGYGTVKRYLSIISNFQIIADSLDVKEFAKRNIKLGYTPDVLTDAGKPLSTITRSDIVKLKYFTVADVSVMLAFMASRNVRETMAVVHEGKVILLRYISALFYFSSSHISGRNSPGVPFYSVVVN